MSHDEAYRIALLVAGHIRGTLTDPQKDELDEWLTAGDSNMELFAELTDEQNIEAALTERRYYDSEKAIAKIKGQNITGKTNCPPHQRVGDLRGGGGSKHPAGNFFLNEIHQPRCASG